MEKEGLHTVFPDELKKFLDGFFLGDVFLDTFLGFVEGDLAATCAYVAIVGICHLTWAIDDTTHDADLETYEIFGGCLDLGDGLLEVVERAAAAWAGDVLGLGELDAGGLEDGIGQFG